MKDKSTKPPKEFTQASLIAFMENPKNEKEVKLAGLGTAATRGGIIKKLFSQGYMQETGKKLYAAEKGIFLLNQLRTDKNLSLVADVENTTAWEKLLKENPAAFQKNMTGYVKNAVSSNAGFNAFSNAKVLGSCPKCGKDIYENKKTYYCAGYKDAPPCGFVIWKSIAGAVITAADVGLLLGKKSTAYKSCASNSGKRFKASFFLNSRNAVEMKFSQKK
jgi:DNA topoisomerase-3